MKKMRRSVAAAAVLACASVVLGACSGGSAEKSNSGASADTSAKGEVATIEYLHRLPDKEGMVKVSDIVAKWNKDHPDIQVKATQFPGKPQELIKKLMKDVPAGKAPCLAQIGYGELSEVYVSNLVEDVTKQAAQYEKDFAKGPWSQVQVDGKTLGIPQDSGPLVYFYNKAEFDKLGLKVPTNVSEFQATAEKAAAQGKYIAAYEPDEMPNLLSAMAAAAGDQWYTIDGDQWSVDTQGKGTTAVADFWQNLLDKKAVKTLPRWDDSFKAALNDQTLIGTIGAAWEVPLLANDMEGSANVGQWAVAQLPDLGDGAKTGPDGGSAVSVVKGCKYVDQAMQFNDWFNSQVDDLATQGLVVASVNKTATPDSQKKFYGGQDVFAELATANEAMAEFTYIPGWSSVVAKITESADAPGRGAGKVADILPDAKTASVSALKDAGLQVK
ncbi:MAG: extracellular solute-binding protein [Actinomycetaceae bacterium]|nr:extracellular solute-binding protein [Actinomycetaceae bacterium]MDY6083461.1 extracellular solute-binding protein [Actinomycetaceae bacterium]